MRFVYQYRTSGNELKSGFVSAQDRESAFALLKSQGIRPARMEDAPGILNKVWGKGKRWIAIAILLVALASSFVVICNLSSSRGSYDVLHPVSRCQIYGDPALMADGAASAWEKVFPYKVERFLAMYAQPGRPVSYKIEKDMLDNFEHVMRTPCEFLPEDTDEIKKLKCIVAGMKAEALEYVSAGGRAERYLQRVIGRQVRELEFFESSKLQLEQLARDKTVSKEYLTSFGERKNETLRAMGIAPIPMSNYTEVR